MDNPADAPPGPSSLKRWSALSDLSPRQKQILEFIAREVSEKGYPPSVREIGEAVGLASSSTVHGHLGKLERKGYIRRDPTKPRAIELLSPAAPPYRQLVNVPVVGRVTAGQPILAVENIEEHFPIARDLIPYEDVFVLRVRGDSMIGAGIFDGDYVFVHQQDHAENGDIVVALIDDEATVKRFFREADHIRLQPENPCLEPILVPQARILGRVVGVFRRLH
jgi:repressor LexA